MRRLFAILLLVMTSLQLAFAGVPDRDASGRLQDAIAVATLAQENAVPCPSHGPQADVESGTPCGPTQPCDACTLCHACHHPALPETSQLAAAFSAGTRSPPVFATPFLSAERAPSFKPPIR